MKEFLRRFSVVVLTLGLCGCQGLKDGPTPPPATPVASLSPASAGFGNQTVGVTSTASLVTLTNTGTAALTLSSIAIGGANSGDFAESNNCGTSLAPGANCTLTLTFTPSATGARSGSVTITDNAVGSPQAVSLTGTGMTAAPIVSLSPASVAFGNQVLTQTSAAALVTMTNTGTAALTISGIAITGTNSTDFAQSNNCGSSLAAGANCTLTLTFTPSAAGALSGSVSITDNAADSPEAVALSGTGVSVASLQSINHVIFMLQENRSFDTYFGMLNPYRVSNGWTVSEDGNTYTVDGIDDKLSTFTNEDDEGQSFGLFRFNSSCIDDMSSAWLESYGDVNRYDFLTTRPILMDGFVHTAEGFAQSGAGDGTFTDLVGQRAMGYYDQGLLNYYYYMASQFAVSDRWFSPVSSKSTPNRIATMTGGTTQGLVRDPFVDDGIVDQLNIETIFQELDQNSVPWKIYYSITAGGCTDEDGDCGQSGQSNDYPTTTFSDFAYSVKYLYENPQQSACIAPTIGSLQAVGDSSNAFCIDITHIAPLAQYFTDVANNTLPSYAFIETAYGSSDEHPGSGQSILAGQQQVSTIINGLMQSPSWASSVFFLSYDEPGGPFDHVPPVPGFSNMNTDASLGTIPDMGTIAVNADSYWPCLPPGGVATVHCDLLSTSPGANAGDAPAQEGFAAQLGFRLPNLVISPFVRMHYVSHIPMDHTAIIKFVENRFINSSAHLTNRDAAQPDLLDFFDFTNTPWATPPTPPTPGAPPGPCTPQTM